MYYFSQKNFFKFRTEIFLLGYIWTGTRKSYCTVVFYISIFIFFQSQKNFKWGAKIPYLSIFWLQFNKDYYQILNKHPRIRETINFHPKQKKVNLGLKKLYLDLLAGMLKNYRHICNQRPPIFLIAKFHAKIRILKFGNKNALFGCFGQ